MSISVKPKKRGRPATGRDPLVAVRMPPDLTTAIDTFAADQDPPSTRSEAVRTLVAKQLTRLGLFSEREAIAKQSERRFTEDEMRASAAEVRSQAADAADEAMSNMDASKQEKAARRGALTDEPAVVGKARTKSRTQ